MGKDRGGTRLIYMNTITIRKIYLYLFALIGLVISTIGAVQLVNLGLKTYVFPNADNYYPYPMEKPVPASPAGATTTTREPSQKEIDTYNERQRTSQRQRDAANALAMLIVGVPLYAYHWMVIKKEKENS